MTQLALQTLGSFDFGVQGLLGFVRAHILTYLDDSSPAIRRDAALAASQVLQRHVRTEPRTIIVNNALHLAPPVQSSHLLQLFTVLSFECMRSAIVGCTFHQTADGELNEIGRWAQNIGRSTLPATNGS